MGATTKTSSELKTKNFENFVTKSENSYGRIRILWPFGGLQTYVYSLYEYFHRSSTTDVKRSFAPKYIRPFEIPCGIFERFSHTRVIIFVSVHLIRVRIL